MALFLPPGSCYTMCRDFTTESPPSLVQQLVATGFITIDDLVSYGLQGTVPRTLVPVHQSNHKPDQQRATQAVPCFLGVQGFLQRIIKCGGLQLHVAVQAA